MLLLRPHRPVDAAQQGTAAKITLVNLHDQGLNAFRGITYHAMDRWMKTGGLNAEWPADAWTKDKAVRSFWYNS